MTSLIAFRATGELEVSSTRRRSPRSTRKMEERGYLEGSEMATTFNMLRSNDLIWSFVINNYLLGRDPFPFGLLHWNADSTRMPAKMHSFYLRNMYMRNALVEPGKVVLDGVPIDLTKVTVPSYFASAIEDHIAPWKATFSNTAMIDAQARYTLASSGHILGVINPPVNPPKRSYWTGDSAAMHADEWLKAQKEVPGTWWEDWVAWLAPRCGDLVAPPPLGSEAYPKLCDAPGTYVHET